MAWPHAQKVAAARRDDGAELQPLGDRHDRGVHEAEERLIGETLNQCGGDKEKAAKMLGISSRTLYRRYAKDEP